ncbi:hypothetical protein [Bradyrhizobium sp. USDA 4011]
MSREQVEIAKDFFDPCRRSRWARNLSSPVSSDLKHWIENWAGRYISTGAVIVAAFELGFACVPTFEGSRNVWIGVYFDDVAARMAERGWHVARDHVTATRIKPPATEYDDKGFFANWARERGIDLSRNVEPKASAPSPAPEPPPTFWEDLAEALGLSETGEV